MISIYALENNKPILFWAGLLLVLEIFSAIAWVYQPAAIIFLAVFVIVLILIYRRRSEFLILLPFLELFWGSMGRSIQYGFFSLRWLVFLVTILFFLLTKIRKISSLKIFKNKIIFRFFLAYLFIILLGIFLGLANGHPWRNIFFDANGYLFFLYLPVWFEYYDEKIFKKIINILLASALVIALKTVVTFYFFTQSNSELLNFYKWIRDTRTGEITKLDNGFFRIFFQSQIYLLLGAAIIFDRLLKYKFTAKKFFYLVILFTAIYISLSRSLWLGFAVALGFLVLLNKKILKGIKYFFWFFLATYALVVVLFNIPNYHQINLLNNRSVSSQEAALSTRTLLLPVMLDSIRQDPVFGHGFGQELTFFSNDPRSKNADNPSGQRTSFSFEWGWLDFMVKGGLFLPILFLCLLIYIIRGTYGIIRSKPEFMPWLAIFLALPFIHIFTPYLNHPLGLGLLALGLINIKHYG